VSELADPFELDGVVQSNVKKFDTNEYYLKGVCFEESATALLQEVSNAAPTNKRF